METHNVSVENAGYSRSLSMEELSSIAREICSSRRIQPLYQESSECRMEKVDSFVNICCKSQRNGIHKGSYHSWPKTSLRKKRYKKCAKKESGDEVAMIGSVLLKDFMRNREEFGEIFFYGKETEKYELDDEKNQLSCHPFYQNEVTNKSSFLAKSKRPYVVNQCHNVTNKCNPSEKVQNMFHSNSEASLRMKCEEEPRPRPKLDQIILSKVREDDHDLFYHEYWDGNQCMSPFVVVDRKDVIIDTDNGKADMSLPIKEKAVWETMPERESVVTKKVSIRQRTRNAQGNKIGDKSAKMEVSKDVGCMIDQVMPEKFNTLQQSAGNTQPQNATPQGLGKKHLVFSEKMDGSMSDSLEHLKLDSSGRNCTQHKSFSQQGGEKTSVKVTDVPCDIFAAKGSFKDESSESSDSGVGNIRYDILLKNWNEPKVNGPLFKKRLEILKQWYVQFDDEQKNIILKMLLDNSELAQMHMLSEIMEPVLHKDCPPNCRDLLTWLPSSVIHHILEYLEPASLARASQVNKAWCDFCNDQQLWHRFCMYPDMQLSPTREREQIIKYTKNTGEIQWKKVFKERYCLRRNWVNAKCEIRTFTGHTQGVSCVQFDETRIVSGSTDKTIKVWDIRTARADPILTLVGHSGTVRCLHLNGNQLVSGSVDTTIKVWDLVVGCNWSSAACKVTMVGHSDTVRCLQVDDEKIVSGSYDKTLKMWDMKTGDCIVTFRGHCAAVLCVQFDDEKIVSGSADRTIKVWNIRTGDCLTTLEGHTDAVTCLQFNFQRIFSGSLDCTLKFWDLCTGQCIGTIDWIRSEGHTRVVRCLQADNWKIVSAGDDKTLKIWSLETGKRFVTLRNHSDGVTCLQFNDHMIVSGSYDKTVKLWDFSPKIEGNGVSEKV